MKRRKKKRIYIGPGYSATVDTDAEAAADADAAANADKALKTQAAIYSGHSDGTPLAW